MPSGIPISFSNNTHTGLILQKWITPSAITKPFHYFLRAFRSFTPFSFGFLSCEYFCLHEEALWYCQFIFDDFAFSIEFFSAAFLTFTTIKVLYRLCAFQVPSASYHSQTIRPPVAYHGADDGAFFYGMALPGHRLLSGTPAEAGTLTDKLAFYAPADSLDDRWYGAF